MVYAELAAALQAQDEVDRFLEDLGIQPDDRFDARALASSGAAWRQYAKARGPKLACPACGTEVAVACPACGAPLAPRQHVLTDFLIAGHAEAVGARLVTRDRGFCRRYFPALELVVPTVEGPPPGGATPQSPK